MMFAVSVIIGVYISAALAADSRMPPSIVKGSVAEKIYRQDDEIQLDCSATGSPKPTYEWHKNGIPLQPSSNVQHVGDGSIMIRPLTSLDEGFYQCRALNMWGTALSNVTYLQRAVLQPYGQPVIEEKKGLFEGQPFVLPYVATKCVPRPAFTWGIARDIVDNSQSTIVPDRRLQVDEDGNLHFSYLTMADMQDGKLYKCNVYNPHLDLTTGGSYARLEIKGTGGVKPFGPVYAFSTPSPVIALEGRNITLRCFFSGYPEPSLTWLKVGGSLPIGRYTILNYNTELTIRNVQPSDEGDYLCRAANSNGIQEHTIQIDVQASPVFKDFSNRPHNINVTEGDRVTINCSAAAEPPAATVVWMKNGIPLDPLRLPPRMRLSRSGLQLTLSDICKDCDDGTSDLQVIQCNASNVHGYAFSDGYVNVLLRTKIDEKPQSVHLEYDQTSATFRCSATSDDSTPVKIDWYYQDNDGYETVVRNVTDRIAILNDGQVLTLSVPENTTGAWAKLRGMYRCRASNGYSTDGVLASLKVDDPPTTVTEVIPPPVEQLAEAGIGDLWWIFVLIAIILLIIILLICCCICLQRRKGDTYKVDEKERKNGNDPEKELADSGFHDYRRPDSEPLKGSRASLVSSSKLSEDDDASSLNEYGDIDAGKFTEDGSFIGDYGTEQRTRTRGRANDSVA